MKAEENPCYKCVPPKRKVGCHSTCMDHKDYLVKYREEQMLIESGRRKESDFHAYSHHKTKRLKGWNHEQ